MLIKKPSDIKPSEITPENVYRNRRKFMTDGAKLMLGSTAVGGYSLTSAAQQGDEKFNSIKAAPDSEPYFTGESLTPYEDVTIYNNFYEFGMNKSDPATRSGEFKTDPWSVEITGEVAKPGKYDLEDILKPVDLEERIYRLRCVEAWSMVIPWIGFPLVDLIKQFEPTSKAKFVEFETIVDADSMPGVCYS